MGRAPTIFVIFETTIEGGIVARILFESSPKVKILLHKRDEDVFGGHCNNGLQTHGVTTVSRVLSKTSILCGRIQSASLIRHFPPP